MFDENSRTQQFKDKDFKVKLGSMLESEVRDYYSESRFSYLQEKLQAAIAKKDGK